MKRYIILAESATGVRGKLMLKGKDYSEIDFIADHVKELLDAKCIAEYTEPVKAEEAETPEKVEEPKETKQARKSTGN